MADDLELYTSGIEKLGTLIGLGSSLKDMLGSPDTLTLPDIKKAVAEEVAKAFINEQIEDKLNDAATALETAQKFIAIDYQNLVDAGGTTAERWTKLDQSSTTPPLTALQEAASALEDWIDNAADTDGTGKLAAKAAPLYLGLCLYICLFHQQRSLVAPDVPDQIAETKDMRDKARTAIARMKPQVLKLIASRLAALEYVENSQRIARGFDGDQLIDHWFSNDDQNWMISWRLTQGSNDGLSYKVALHRVADATARLLSSGEQVDADALWNAQKSAWVRRPPWGDIDPTQDFQGLTFSDVLNFGTWAKQVRNLLMQLDILASNVAGNEQDQWAWCSRCSALAYSALPSRCPAAILPNSPHLHNDRSNNYVLHCDSPEPLPAGMQNNWRWCSKCGCLHFTAAGSQVCAAGGTHESNSFNYALPTAPIPDAGQRGIDTVQQGWRWCGKCSVLHFPEQQNACPAGGTHDTAGSSDYWLSSIGTMPQAWGFFIASGWS